MAELSEEEKLAKEQEKELKREIRKKKRQERKAEKGSIWEQFKKFISRGNIIDMAVGVIMGGAFNGIANSFTKILMSVCTWGVPGGINGLVTVLPALNDAQRGVNVISCTLNETTGEYEPNANKEKVWVQKFDKDNELTKIAVEYAITQGAVDVKNANSDGFIQWKNSLVDLYDLHGTTYTYKQSAVIDWGTFLNALISFLIIAISLFTVVKVYNIMKEYRVAFEAQMMKKLEELKKKDDPDSKNGDIPDEGESTGESSEA